MRVSVTKLLERIKNLREFEVVMDMPENFVFKGIVPWDMRAVDRTFTVTLLALTQEEADQKVFDFFHN